MRKSLLFIVLLSACGGSTEPGETPASQPTAPPAAKPAAPTPEARSTATPAPTSAAAAPTSDASSPPQKESKGPFRYPSYNGPTVALKVDTPKAWGVVPIGRRDDWELLKFMFEEYVRTEGNLIVLKHFDGSEYHLPGALVFPARKVENIKKGDALVADEAASSVFARAISVDKEAGTVKLKYEFGGSVSDDELDLDRVIKLEDKLSFGQPVAWKAEDVWNVGELCGSDKEKAFVLDASSRARVVPTADLRVIKTAPLKKGDKVWAREWELKPATIVEVLEGGLRYKVRFDGGTKDETVTFNHVTLPLK